MEGELGQDDRSVVTEESTSAEHVARADDARDDCEAGDHPSHGGPLRVCRVDVCMTQLSVRGSPGLRPGGGRTPSALDDSQLLRQDGRLGAAAQSQLGQQVADVRLDGRLGHAETVRGFRVGEALAEAAEHFAFARVSSTSSGVATVRAGRPRRSGPGELGDEAPRHSGGDHAVAARDGPYGVYHFGRFAVLEEEARRPRRAVRRRRTRRGRRWSAPVRRRAVHRVICPVAVTPSRRGIWMSISTTCGAQFTREQYRLLAVPGLADDLDAAGTAQDEDESRPYCLLVLGDEHADWVTGFLRHRGFPSSTGSSARTSTPSLLRGRRGTARSVPPSSSTRSRMPIRPYRSRAPAGRGHDRRKRVGDVDCEGGPCGSDAVRRPR